MGLRLQIVLSDHVALDRELERFSGVGLDLTEPFGAIADSFVKAEQRQFSTQGAYGGAPWAPLSPKYAAWKARHFPGKPILRRTDELFTSLTQGPAIREIGRDLLVMGSPVTHGKYHARGGGRLPRRDPIGVPEALRREWMSILHKFVVTGRL